MANPEKKNVQAPAQPEPTLEQLRLENKALAEASEVARLKAENKRLKDEVAAAEANVKPTVPSFKNAKGQEVPEAFRGERTYRLGQPHYRGGRYLQAGELITVTDEVPSRTWTPVGDEKAEPAPVAPVELGRPSDQQV